MSTDHAFHRAGYGSGSIPLGAAPAIVVVDFQEAFTRAGLPFGGGEHVQAAVQATQPMLAAARAAQVPVMQTVVAWREDSRDFGPWRYKVPDLANITLGSRFARVEPALADPNDLVYVKTMPSAFFGTPLLSALVQRGRDTVVVCGATTSGCVRASIVDSFSYGFRTVAVSNACGDQDPQAHAANLADVGRRYAEVLTTEDIISYFHSLAHGTHDEACQERAAAPAVTAEEEVQ